MIKKVNFYFCIVTQKFGIPKPTGVAYGDICNCSATKVQNMKLYRDFDNGKMFFLSCRSPTQRSLPAGWLMPLSAGSLVSRQS